MSNYVFSILPILFQQHYRLFKFHIFTRAFQLFKKKKMKNNSILRKFPVFSNKFN